MVKKHSEHKGPAPPPPSSVVKSVSNEEPLTSPLVLKVQDSNQEKESQFVEPISEPKELEIPKSKNDDISEINDSLNNNSEIETQSIDNDIDSDDMIRNSVSVQSIELRKHDILNPRPISVAASPIINSMDDSLKRSRRRSSSASNRNQRRPSPPSLDKVLQMNQNIEKNKGKMPTAVMNELAGRLLNNQDETDRFENKNDGN